MVRCGPVVAVLAFGAIAAILLWSHLAMAALTLCRNETPILATGVAQAVPASNAIATRMLTLLGPLGVDASALPPNCETAAPARAMAVAGMAYVAAIFLLDSRLRLPRTLTFGVVLGVAVLIRIAMFFMPALLSSDIIDYASHGRVASIHAANPYVQTPSDFPSDPYSNLGAWASVVTVYGPLWTRVDALVTGLMPNATATQVAFAYKLIATGSEILSAALLVWIAVRWRKIGATSVAPVVVLAMWLWNPLVNLELVGNAHNEALMIALVLVGFGLLTFGVGRSSQRWIWYGALLSIWLGALVKFVPAAIEAIVALVWLRTASPARQRLLQAGLLVLALVAITLVVAAPWLGSPAVAAPLMGVAAGGQRFKDVWQDAPAAWLTVRVVPLLGVPDTPATLRMDVARMMVWSVTRALFAGYVLFEGRLLWRRACGPPALVLRSIAAASVRVLLLALLLYTSQVYAWYFLWPLPAACLLGPRNGWSRAVIVFGLTFLPAFYLREFEPYGVFSMPIYAEIGLAILAGLWFWTSFPRLRAAAYT